MSAPLPATPPSSLNVVSLPTEDLPPGLRQNKPGEYLIQLSREGQRLTQRVRGSRAEALRALESAKVEIGRRLAGATESRSRNGSAGPSQPVRRADVPTLAEFLAEGGRYENHQLRKQSDRTRRKLVAPMRYLIASDLGPKRLDEITTADVNDYVSWRAKSGAMTFATRKDGEAYRARTDKVSAPTINKSLRVLSSALRFAHREGLIDKLPFIELLPESDAKRVKAPTKEEFDKALGCAEKLRAEAHWLPEVIELFAEFGFRPSELFCLTWASVDWAIGKGKGGVWVEEQQKTSFVPKDRERRLVPMSPRGRTLLKKLWARTPTPAPEDLVVPNQLGLPYMRMDVPEMKGGGAGIWKTLQKRTGARVTMYSLRHYFAQQTLAAGVPLHVVSKWMGHSKVELTAKRYGDFAPDNAEQWAWASARSAPR